MQTSANTQAILLLTAPLLIGKSERSAPIMTNGEYKLVARRLRELGREPADLLGPDAPSLLRELEPDLPADRLTGLLGRGFLLSQVLERWAARAIWVVSRADQHYPKRLKLRCKEDAPPVLYGCGDVTLLEAGGLAVVGSREVGEEDLSFTESVGCLAAHAGRSIISGGAKGVDQAAMGAALREGGRAVGVLADSLERAALNRENRQFLMNGELVLVSPFDPAAGFNVGNAMQRNKYIYALADAALVVKSDFQKGGTWAGAAEQLQRFKFVPVYVRSLPERNKGLDGLQQMGAVLWPNPDSPEALGELLIGGIPVVSYKVVQEELSFFVGEELQEFSRPLSREASAGHPEPSAAKESEPSTSEMLIDLVREITRVGECTITEAQFTAALDLPKAKARESLRRLVDDGVLKKLTKPVRYQFLLDESNLFSAINFGE